MHIMRSSAFEFTWHVMFADNLVQLESVIGLVRNTKHVVLLATEQVLLRPWCICELVTAVGHKIPITVVKVGDAPLPDIQRLQEGLDLLLTFKCKCSFLYDNISLANFRLTKTICACTLRQTLAKFSATIISRSSMFCICSKKFSHCHSRSSVYQARKARW